jgi:hypothetical protein
VKKARLFVIFRLIFSEKAACRPRFRDVFRVKNFRKNPLVTKYFSKKKIDYSETPQRDASS